MFTRKGSAPKRNCWKLKVKPGGSLAHCFQRFYQGKVNESLNKIMILIGISEVFGKLFDWDHAKHRKNFEIIWDMLHLVSRKATLFPFAAKSDPVQKTSMKHEGSAVVVTLTGNGCETTRSNLFKMPSFSCKLLGKLCGLLCKLCGPLHVLHARREAHSLVPKSQGCCYNTFFWTIFAEIATQTSAICGSFWRRDKMGQGTIFCVLMFSCWNSFFWKRCLH